MLEAGVWVMDLAAFELELRCADLRTWRLDHLLKHILKEANDLVVQSFPGHHLTGDVDEALRVVWRESRAAVIDIEDLFVHILTYDVEARLVNGK